MQKEFSPDFFTFVFKNNKTILNFIFVNMSLTTIQTKNGIQYIEFLGNKQCIAGVSTRKGGVSKGSYASLNLGLNTNDNPEHVHENRTRFFETIAPGCQVAYLRQTHSNIVRQVDTHFENNCEGDALFTRQRNTLLSITTADCGAVILHDKNFTIAAAIHCGWRGLHAHIIEKTIHEMCKFVNPRELIAYIGPSIQQENYEVGKEFFDFFPAGYIKSENNHYFFNINQCIVKSLQKTHVGNIVTTDFDTFSQSDYFFSYRRDTETGRMSIFVGILS
jgi:YfiH family protein